MASQGFAKSYSRISAVDLIRRTPTVPSISEWTARFGSGLCCLAILLLLSYAASGAIDVWLLVLAVISSCVSFWVTRRIDGRIATEFVNKLLRSMWLRSPTIYEDSRKRSSTVSGVKAGSLACLKEEYKKLARYHHSVHGRSAEPPDVRYHLVIATYQLDGNHRVIATSDGEIVTWHRASGVFVTQLDAPWWRMDRPEETEASLALAELIKILYEESSEQGIRGIHGRLGNFRVANIDRALDAACWWRMIREDIHFAVHLTEAGRHWHLATEEFEAARIAERKKMSNGTGSGPQFNIGNLSGVLYYAGNNISGKHQHDIKNGQPSDAQVISCLREILGSTEIPWSNPDLVGVREIIEDAVVQQNPHRSGLKQAVAKLKEVCEQVSIGMLGNGAYQLLIQYLI